MSDSHDSEHPDEAESDATSELSDEHMRRLLQGALGSPEADRISVLGGVQRKLRQRSRGKFYDDAWSTAQHPPVYTYLLTAALMLAVLFVIYAVLIPTSGEPVPVNNEPAPVQIIAPKR